MDTLRSRSFIGLFPPKEVLDKILIIQSKLKHVAGNVRWEKNEKFHFTLQFWGDQTEQWLTNVSTNLKDRCSQIVSFNTTLTKAGCFPNRYSPKIFWIGSDPHENEELVQLSKMIQQVTALYGFQPEQKPFHPHITIGRTKGKINPDLLQNLETVTFQPIVFRCTEIRIMKSQLASTGSTYTTLYTLPLT
jgi:2'-5' RNA ligase